jgi:hypothetical protein
MIRNNAPFARVPGYALGLLVLASCTDPTKPDTTAHPPIAQPPPEVEDCAASKEWLPTTPELGAPTFVRPAAHPETECPFYRGAWQTFLLAGQPDARPDFAGEPAIKSYPVLDDVFDRTVSVKGRLAAAGAPRGTQQRAWLGDIKQAGGREILIDQNGHTLYYGIHVNQAFVDFVNDNDLKTAFSIQNADPNLFLPGGLAEFKSAWQEVDGITDPNDPELANYIWTKAFVPTLSQAADGTIEEDRDHPREIYARLLAIHVVFTIPGHPEFVWGSMEHSDIDMSASDATDTKAADGHRNVAPVVPPDPATGELRNPTLADPNNGSNTTVVAPSGNYLLYRNGVQANQGDQSISKESDLLLDSTTQKFTMRATGETAQTPIYRMFPASKSNTTDPDDAITSLNHNVEALFRQTGNVDPNDKRMHYRLVGAQWMDKPNYFALNSFLQNDETSALIQSPAGATNVNQADERDKVLQAPPAPPSGFVCPSNLTADGCAALVDLRAHGSDSPFSILAGEDRMSSTAMESFTQRPDSFFNCFSCHNTRAVTAKGVPMTAGDTAQIQLMAPKLLNVSHVFSQFVLEECGEDPNLLQANPDSPGAKRAVCPGP